MKIRVNPHNVEIVREETEPINELEVKVSKCEFEFDEKITNEFVKEAYFTLNGSTYKQIIVNNECDYPNEVLTQTGTLEIGVVAYKVENGEELIRYNPSPDYYDTWVGSLKDAENTEPLTPTDKEQMQSQISQNTSDISDLQANKQDKLTAGDNITIDENNVISATDTIYDDTEIKADIQELQETKVDKDVNNLTYYTLTTETGSKITLSIDSSTYVMTLKLKDKNNNDISTANVDLPLETMVVGARYDSATKEIVLTLKNGQEVRFSVADLVSGLQTEITENNKLSSDLVDDTNNINKFVSAEEKAQITTNKNDITAIKDGQNIDSFSDVETALNLKEDKSNKVTEINSSSTDTQYPSAKCVYDSQEVQNEHIAELEMLYNAFPTVSAENETIQLDNTAKVKFREIDLKGNTSQVVIPEEQGTSVSNTSIYVSDVNTDKESSIEMSGNTYQNSTTGKNLCEPFVYETSSTKNGITVSYDNEKQTYTFNGACNADNTTFKFSNNSINFTANTTKMFIYWVNGSVTNYCMARLFNNNYNGPTQDITSLSPTTTYLSKTFDTTIVTNSNNSTIRFNNGSVATNFTIKLMITDSDNTDFEKFTFGSSPNPSYPQTIEVVTGQNNITICGKNLFNKNNVNILNANFAVDNKKIFSSQNGKTLWIPCQDNTTYTISKISSTRFRILTTTRQPTIGVVGVDYYQNETATSITITTSNGVKYLCVYYYLNGTDTLTEQQILDSIQIEKGSTATTYEAYQGTTYPINLGNIELCKIDTYQDKIYKQNDKWYVEKSINKYIMNGSEGGSIDFKQSNLNYYSCNFYIGSVKPSSVCYCNKLKYSNVSIFTNDIQGIKPTSIGQIKIKVFDSSLSTVQAYQSWLSNNNLLVYYIMDTPTTTEITDTNLVNQLNALYNANIYPITNINTDTSNLLPYIDLHYNFVTPSPSPSRPSNVNVVKGNNTITIANSDNTESQNYPINLGDMELRKIGTYQDYIYESNGNWYFRKNINKITLNGSEENWSSIVHSGDYYRLALAIEDAYDFGLSRNTNLYCNMFKASTTNNYNIVFFSNKSAYFYLPQWMTTKEEFMSFLSTNNPLFYYVLSTPTDTQITDATLISQLNTIKKAYSYDTQTNISQTNADKPFIIYAEAVRSLKDVFE